jgi:hypothetical protein
MEEYPIQLNIRIVWILAFKQLVLVQYRHSNVIEILAWQDIGFIAVANQE